MNKKKISSDATGTNKYAEFKNSNMFQSIMNIVLIIEASCFR